MNDPIINNSLHLLTEATDKMARQRQRRNDGNNNTRRDQDDNDSSKQQQPRNLITTVMNNNRKNNNDNDKKKTMTSDSEDDMVSTPNNKYSHSNSIINQKNINVNYNRNTNVRIKSNKRDNYDDEECDDDEEEVDEEETDDDDEINEKNVPQRVLNKKKKYYNHPVRELLPEKNLSPTSSECLTNSTNSSYHNFVVENGQEMTSNDLSNQVELIVKEYVWCQYKLPDDTDYQYNSRFSKIILHQLNCETKDMNAYAQEMWGRIVKMVKAEYQITRSTVTQAMKSTFFGKYCDNK